MFATVGLTGWGLWHLTLYGTDSRLNETLAQMYALLLGSTIGSYVFGAVWHDRGLMQAKVDLAQSDAGSPTPEATPSERSE